MPRTLRRAAAWAAPILRAVHDVPKKTHKLPPMPCVLWLPDYGAYVRSVNRRATAFSLTKIPEDALRLDDDQAEVTGQDLVDGTGVRVHLRPFNKMQ